MLDVKHCFYLLKQTLANQTKPTVRVVYSSRLGRHAPSVRQTDRHLEWRLHLRPAAALWTGHATRLDAELCSCLSLHLAPASSLITPIVSSVAQPAPAVEDNSLSPQTSYQRRSRFKSSLLTMALLNWLRRRFLEGNRGSAIVSGADGLRDRSAGFWEKSLQLEMFQARLNKYLDRKDINISLQYRLLFQPESPG